MRLIDVQTLKLHSFHGGDIPPYAILSHTWLRDDEEITFAQMQNPASCFDLPGFKKIDYLCQQAIKDTLAYAWIDTCCIDKTNSTELYEAINSMCNWYGNSIVCYAYLRDVIEGIDDNIMDSRWWRRAWTLQELLAPGVVQFYDKRWNLIGTKEELAHVIFSHTGIDHEVLDHPQKMYVKSVAQRMSWAASRDAARIEDRAYSLLGIFDTTMSMKYGEGPAAFGRLQRKIMKLTNDQTLFAWGFTQTTLDLAISPEHATFQFSRHHSTIIDHEGNKPTGPFLPSQSQTVLESPSWHPFGIFADSPAQFANCGELVFHDQHVLDGHVAEFNGALQTTLPLGIIEGHTHSYIFSERYAACRIGLLPCGHAGKTYFMIGLLLEEWTPGR